MTRTPAPPTLRALLEADDPDLRASLDHNAARRALALQLRALRRDAGLTQAGLAGRSGLSQSHVSKIESATGQMPNPETMQRYAAACGARMVIDFRPDPRLARVAERRVAAGA